MDDTLLISSQKQANITRGTISIMYETVKDKLKERGLSLSPSKTQVLWSSSEKAAMEGVKLLLDDHTDVSIKKSIRYLGIQLDGGLRYRDHILIRASKTKNMLNGLRGILHNVKGPKEGKRRLYMNAVQSSMLYGCPHWIEGFKKDKSILNPYQELNGLLAQRIISAYKTVSRVEAELLARVPPIHLLAHVYADTYAETAGYHVGMTRERKKEILNNNRERIYNIWRNELCDPRLPGRRVREAIVPIFYSWIERESGQLDYYMTQILTGHGSFRRYLYRINKIDSEICLHCRLASDIAEHTLVECTSWSVERQELKKEVGEDLSLNIVLVRMLASTSAWRAFRVFCKTVLKKKEQLVSSLIVSGEIER